jgi:PAS domain-containing protein
MKKAIDISKVELSTDYISGYDADLKIVIWNTAVAKRYRIAKQDAIGRNLLELFPHLHDDFRVKCFKRTIHKKEEFFFPSLPYQFDKGIYTQLILPQKGNKNFDVLSIVRNHVANERYSKTDVLKDIVLSN